MFIRVLPSLLTSDDKLSSKLLSKLSKLSFIKFTLVVVLNNQRESDLKLLGLTPNSLVKQRVKYLGSLKPTL